MAQHIPKQVQELHTSKVKHTQTEQSERREIVINRNVQCPHIQSSDTTEHPKRQLKQKHMLSTNEKQPTINTVNTA